DLARRQSAGVQADNGLVETLKTPLPFGHDLRLKSTVAITRRLQRPLPTLSLEGLGRAAVARVAAVVAGRIVFVIAQMHRKLCTHGFFQQSLLQLLEQPVLAQQIFGLLVVLK